MKNMIFIIAVISTSFYSCTPDNPNPNSNNNNPTSINPTYTQGPAVNDIDGNTYSSVVNCGQTWTSKNLDVSHYRNGDIIPQVADFTQWENLTTGAWCYYENVPGNGSIYGKLYNFYAVNDPRGLAPSGWHIPTDTEWSSLEVCLGGSSIAGGKMKEIGFTHWNSFPLETASNSSGFSALPGGYRSPNGGSTFLWKGTLGYWWSSSSAGITSGYGRSLFYGNTEVGRNSGINEYGFSVRCIKD